MSARGAVGQGVARDLPLIDSGMHGPVLHVVSSAGFYGIERMLGDLLPALQAAGQPVALLSLVSESASAGEREVGRVLAAKGIPTHEVSVPRGVTVRSAWRLARVIHSLRPRLVHPHGYKATILAGGVARLAGIRVMPTVHSEAWHAPELARALRTEAWILRRLPRVAAVSAGVAADLARRGLSPARVEVVANGIADPGVRSAPPRPIRELVVVGRLITSKGTHLALEAIANLTAGHPDLRLTVAGAGPEADALRALAARLGIAARVRFPGHVADTPRLLADSDLFVMASQSEGMPMAVLEAMAHRLPIVATAVGGIPTMLRHGIEALLVPAEDVLAIGGAIARLVADRELADRLAEAARQRFLSAFTAERMAAEYQRLYDAPTSA